MRHLDSLPASLPRPSHDLPSELKAYIPYWERGNTWSVTMAFPGALGGHSGFPSSAYARRRMYNQLALDTPFSKQTNYTGSLLGRTTSPALRAHEEAATRRRRSLSAQRQPTDDIPLGRHSAARAASRHSRCQREANPDGSYEGQPRSPFSYPKNKQEVFPCWNAMTPDDFGVPPHGGGTRLVAKEASSASREVGNAAVAEALRNRLENVHGDLHHDLDKRSLLASEQQDAYDFSPASADDHRHFSAPPLRKDEGRSFAESRRDSDTPRQGHPQEFSETDEASNPPTHAWAECSITDHPSSRKERKKESRAPEEKDFPCTAEDLQAKAADAVQKAQMLLERESNKNLAEFLPRAPYVTTGFAAPPEALSLVEKLRLREEKAEVLERMNRRAVPLSVGERAAVEAERRFLRHCLCGAVPDASVCCAGGCLLGLAAVATLQTKVQNYYLLYQKALQRQNPMETELKRLRRGKLSPFFPSPPDIPAEAHYHTCMLRRLSNAKCFSFSANKARRGCFLGGKLADGREAQRRYKIGEMARLKPSGGDGRVERAGEQGPWSDSEFSLLLHALLGVCHCITPLFAQEASKYAESMPGPNSRNMVKAVAFVASSSHLHPAIEKARRAAGSSSSAYYGRGRLGGGRSRGDPHSSPEEAQKRHRRHSQLSDSQPALLSHWQSQQRQRPGSTEPREGRRGFEDGQRGRDSSKRSLLDKPSNRSRSVRSQSPKAPAYRAVHAVHWEGMRRTDGLALYFKDGRVISPERELVFAAAPIEVLLSSNSPESPDASVSASSKAPSRNGSTSRPCKSISLLPAKSSAQFGSTKTSGESSPGKLCPARFSVSSLRGSGRGGGRDLCLQEESSRN
ncbi:hypothetical protein cyc_02187 [Cyclospora cayetanensis]|uniref:Uncharacterized protein n=1 Tax=Cyclospora cayetanensis TaxID=88456 RepID=A0A1D3D1Y8_9EIME|nr:hypothetical protein cyc_02187 [Cyclospora cayetanensis]